MYNCTTRQEREAMLKKREKLGEAILFFGCRAHDQDYLYVARMPGFWWMRFFFYCSKSNSSEIFVYVESADSGFPSGKGIASSLEIWSAVNSACCFQSRSWYLDFSLEYVLGSCIRPRGLMLFFSFFASPSALMVILHSKILECFSLNMKFHPSSSMQTHTHKFT